LLKNLIGTNKREGATTRMRGFTQGVTVEDKNWGEWGLKKKGTAEVPRGGGKVVVCITCVSASRGAVASEPKKKTLG